MLINPIENERLRFLRPAKKIFNGELSARVGFPLLTHEPMGMEFLKRNTLEKTVHANFV